MTIPFHSDMRSKIIFGVDDSLADLALLSAVLGSAGYTFVSATSGEDCLNMIRRCPPRLILLDIEMAGLDGIETCRRLRDISELKDIPIAFLTARKTPHDVKAGLAAGGNDFIIKPIKSAGLLQRVQHWMTHRVCGPTRIQ